MQPFLNLFDASLLGLWSEMQDTDVGWKAGHIKKPHRG